MGPPRSKKRKPTFRKLLKTSNVKLENKLKNRHFKQQSSSKKYRKEQKRLRQALKDESLRTPAPLERYKKRAEEEPEEEFEESLPVDMMEENDLEEMRAMGQKASFLTRDISSCEPGHARKRKSGNAVETYEKKPRRMPAEEKKEVIHLLPIKDKTGIIRQTMEKPVVEEAEEEEEEEAELQEEENESGYAEAIDMSALDPEEQLQLRRQRLQDRKTRIAGLGSAILSDPTTNIKKLKELRSMLMEADPCVAVTVRKVVMISLMEILKDIVPSYRIRPLTEEEKATKVKKETQQLREFEEGLVSQYKFYLEDLEQTVKDWKQKKKKKSETVSLQAYKGLALVAIRCLCELMVALPHFNFHNNILVMVAPLLNDASPEVSTMCCEHVKKLLKQDKMGHASLGMVKVISGLVKSRNYDVNPEVLKCLLSLRIKEVELKKDTEHVAPKKKFMTYKEKKKNLSRMQRKWKKAEEKLEKELLEAEASESKDKKIKLHTETLNIVFLIYFRILKKAQKSVLLPVVLEGLAKFAHLINLEFFDDLLTVLHNLIESKDLTYRECLHCIQTSFTILSGQGDVLNIDPLKFYTHLYKILLHLHAGATNDDVRIVLHCLESMLAKRRKQVTLQRALAFLKRMSTLSLHVLPNSTVGLLASGRTLMHAFPKCDLLLDNESQGSGVYLPELQEPEFCNPHNTALWELHMLTRHYHPMVRKFATHLVVGAPSEGSRALSSELSRRSAVDLFEEYSPKDMTFNPPVPTSSSKKKEHFDAVDVFLDAQLKRQVDDALADTTASSALDFATHFGNASC
uniref:Nucleolar complex protein 3 homolog n=1 Tax=Paramormyrops kingsleyae TaxID=1676925 RepID=A0A3B3RUA3_9TELE|nr:nucleolar complex protein 3 homolog isoform X1 [Paramormyrops kingsleyae]